MKSKWMSGLLLVAIGFSFTQVMVHAGETADTEENIPHCGTQSNMMMTKKTLRGLFYFSFHSFMVSIEDPLVTRGSACPISSASSSEPASMT